MGEGLRRRRWAGSSAANEPHLWMDQSKRGREGEGEREQGRGGREWVSFGGQMWRGEERVVAVAGGGIRLELEVNTCAERWAGREGETCGLQ